jgi:hypothetical protein
MIRPDYTNGCSDRELASARSDEITRASSGVHISMGCPETIRMKVRCFGVTGPVTPASFRMSYFAVKYWSEREDLNLRPLVSQTSALTGLRHAPMPFP